MLSISQLNSKWGFRLLFLVLTLVLFGTWMTLLNNSWREGLRHWYWDGDRRVLATLDLEVGDDEKVKTITVLKVAEGGSLFLEFYQRRTLFLESEAAGLESQIEKIQKIQLANPFDGYVSFIDRATNLGAMNLDGDPRLEILVPTFSRDLVAALDVVKYNPGLNSFELLQSFEMPEAFPVSMKGE